MADDQWWYDLTTKSVVPADNQTKAADRLGPYASRAEAERAMDKVDERNEAYDHDPRWEE